VINDAKKIKTIGATGAYTKEFDEMEKKLGFIQKLLENATISTDEVEKINEYQIELRKQLNNSIDMLQGSDKVLEKLYNTINFANVELDSLRKKSDAIKIIAADLKENATKLQEANVEGALNLTRAAWGRVTALEEDKTQIQNLNTEAERQCRRTEAMIERSKTDFETLSEKNEQALSNFNDDILVLQADIPDLNSKMCDGKGFPCDSLCGGAGCNKCGGLSCDKGALSKANKALEFSKDTEANIKKKEETAENLIRSLSQAKSNASEIFYTVEQSFLNAERFYNQSARLIESGNKLVDELTDASNNKTASPEEIRELADKTLALDLQLDPEEIKSLATKIDITVASLKDVEQIIENTRNDLSRVEELKQIANHTKQRADNVLETANKVVLALSETEEAQEKALEAIKKSKTDVELAKNDLGQIDIETIEAHKRANETSNTVDHLQSKLHDLQKRLLTIDSDAEKVQRKAENVKSESAHAFGTADNLRNNYKATNDKLNERAKTSEDARERAQQLLKRASKITVETDDKLKELNEIFDSYKSNEKELNVLEEKIDSLNDRMNGYLSQIQENADRYRQCSS
jgi:coxsackievirus/adenovirus receptor